MKLIFVLLLPILLSAENYRLDVREWGVLEGAVGSDSFSFAYNNSQEQDAKYHVCPTPYRANEIDRREREYRLKKEMLRDSMDVLNKAYDLAEGKEKQKIREKMLRVKLTELQLRRSTEAVAKEPVLYFDLENIEHFSVRVDFTTGTPTVTYPPAQVDSNRCVWPSVKAVADAPLNKMPAIPETQRREILRINNVKSQAIQVDSFATRSLFYEGDLVFQNHLLWEQRQDSITVVNSGGYAVYNCYVLIREPVGAGMRIALLDTIAPQSQITVATESFYSHLPEQKRSELSLQALLVDQGFTPEESAAFELIWVEKLFARADLESGICFYQLPQHVVDVLLPLTIEPQPTSVTRALFVLAGLQ